MGVSVEVWRACIGGFVQPGIRPRFRPPVIVTHARYYRALVWTVLFAAVLIRAGDPQANSISEPTARGSSDNVMSTTTTQLDMWLPELQARHATMIATRLMVCGDVESNPGPGPGSSRGRGGRGGRGVAATQLLPLGVQTRLSSSQGQLTLGTSNEDIIKRVVNLEGQVYDLKKENESLVRKLDALENQSRRNNLIVYGLPEDEKENWDQSEEKVKAFMKEKLQIDDDIAIERAHRLGKRRKVTQNDEGNDVIGNDGREGENEQEGDNPPDTTRYKSRPVIMKFSSWKDRELVLSASRDKLKGQKTGFKVIEDFSDRVREARRSLIPQLIRYREIHTDTSTKVYLRYDKLVVGKEVYAYNQTTGTIDKLNYNRQEK